MKKSNVLILALMASLFFVGCSKDDDNSEPDPVVIPPPPTAVLKVTFNGIEPLNDNYVYEGWIMVNGNPVSTGKFNSGLDAEKQFTVLKSDLDIATAFVLSIELAVGDTPEPSNTKILSGVFEAGAAGLKIDSVIGDFVANPFSGSFINKTPSDNANGIDNGNDQNGVWFMTDTMMSSLTNLPTLAAGWKYEGWVIFGNAATPIPVTTGKFTMASGPDGSSPYSGNWPVPLFPGEDFVQDLPDGVVDGDTTGRNVVISIEPDFPSDPSEPFFLKPIGGTQDGVNNALTLTSNINVTINGTAIK